MAVIDLSINIPNAQIPRFIAGMRASFGKVDDGAGGLRDMTQAELIERVRQSVIQTLRERVRTAEREEAIRAAAQPELDAT